MNWLLHIRVVGLLLLLWLSSFRVSAQSVWNKTYVEDRPLMIFSSVINDGDGYKVVGLTRDTAPPYTAKFLLASIDSVGTISSYKTEIDTAQVDFGIFFNSLLKTKANTYAVAGYLIDSVSKALFAQFNSGLDSIYLHYYATPNTYAFYGSSLIEHESCFFEAGVFTSSITGNADIVLIKIDSSGERLWEKYYNNYKQDYAKSLVLLKNGNLMLGAVRNDLGYPIEHANTWLLEVDTGGNIVRQWFDPNDSTYAAEGLLQTQDGGFIYGAQKKFEQSGNLVAYTATIVKMDSAFNKQWVFEDGFRSIYTIVNDIIQLPDGNVIGCGSKPIFGSDTFTVSGWVVKLNSFGDVIWNKVYRGIDTPLTKNFLTDIDVMEDGGLIAVGQCQKSGNVPPQMGWFLKLDSNGCEIENCLTGFAVEKESPLVQVFPNPFTSTISIAVTGHSTSEVSAVIYNAVGKMVYKKEFSPPTSPFLQAVDLSRLAKGVYFVLLKFDDQVIVKRLLKVE